MVYGGGGSVKDGLYMSLILLCFALGNCGGVHATLARCEIRDNVYLRMYAMNSLILGSAFFDLMFALAISPALDL
jgi:hypothetical protein